MFGALLNIEGTVTNFLQKTIKATAIEHDLAAENVRIMIKPVNDKLDLEYILFTVVDGKQKNLKKVLLDDILNS